MARFKGDFSFTGSLGNVSAYTMRGCDHVILRTKGGANRDKIKNSASFARTREMNKEWGACAKMGAAIRMAIYPVKHMADFNISGPLNALAKTVQKFDTIQLRGKRGIYFTNYKELLSGFNLNNTTTFDGVVRHPVTCTIDRATSNANLLIPGLIPGINFINRFKNPYFRFVVALGVVSDIEYDEALGNYQITNLAEKQCASIYTDWQPSLIKFGGQAIRLEINNGQKPADNETLILSVGIEFGNPLSGSIIEQIKYSGSAKIIATA
jgi:hypothetical protein